MHEILEVGASDEEDLDAALECLAAQQSVIETALAPQATPGAVFLYDVTSVYFEGTHNELAAFGYHRDGKQGKQPMVAGLLTDGMGEPLAIQPYAGNTSDPPTFLDAVTELKPRFGTEEIAVVGDQGMIKALGQAALGAANFRYVTALTDPQARGQLKAGVLQLDPFDDAPAEMTVGAKRYVLRCNPQTQARERAREWIEVRNAQVAVQPRCQPAASLQGAQVRLKTYRLESWVSVRLEGREVVWTEHMAARERSMPRRCAQGNIPRNRRRVPGRGTSLKSGTFALPPVRRVDMLRPGLTREGSRRDGDGSAREGPA